MKKNIIWILDFNTSIKKLARRSYHLSFLDGYQELWIRLGESKARFFAPARQSALRFRLRSPLWDQALS
jgi:hypothetical protein